MTTIAFFDDNQPRVEIGLPNPPITRASIDTNGHHYVYPDGTNIVLDRDGKEVYRGSDRDAARKAHWGLKGFPSGDPNPES